MPQPSAPAAEEAYVEAELELPEGFFDEEEFAALAELQPAGEEGLVLARRVFADGRTRAYAWGRAIAREDVAAAAERLIAMSGQFEQRRLSRPSYQLDLLDAFVGEEQGRRRSESAQSLARAACGAAPLRRADARCRRRAGEAGRVAGAGRGHRRARPGQRGAIARRARADQPRRRAGARGRRPPSRRWRRRRATERPVWSPPPRVPWPRSSAWRRSWRPAPRSCAAPSSNCARRAARLRAFSPRSRSSPTGWSSWRPSSIGSPRPRGASAASISPS